MNKYVVYSIVVVLVVLFLIYRKKIFRDMKPTLDDLKNKIIAGEGMQTQKTNAGTFVKGTEGDRISEMLKQTAANYSVRDLEAATRNWDNVGKSVDRSLFDSLNLTSRPVSVSELYNKKSIALDRGPAMAIEDISRIIRNQVVINDLWGHPCYCSCGCQDGFRGVTVSRFNLN